MEEYHSLLPSLSEGAIALTPILLDQSLIHAVGLQVVLHVAVQLLLLHQNLKSTLRIK